MKKYILSVFFAVTALIGLATAASAQGKSPMETRYSYDDCQGSLVPYPADIHRVNAPDTLMPVYISHVGRHGSRYPASSANCIKLRDALNNASETGTITELGRDLLSLTENIIAVSTNRWGALDSLGQAEQRAIASRMFSTYPEIFRDGAINAISSYSPRSMMSMFSFVHQLDRMDNKLTFTTSTGRINSKLMRPFDVDKDYLEFRDQKLWQPAYTEYFEAACPITAINRVLGKDYPYGDTDNARDLAITEYYVLAGLEAMQMPSQMKKYFTVEEANALWSCFNLRQYLQRTATTVSSVPADIASELVMDIITRADGAFDGSNPFVADLRFGHAETVMPLVSLLRLPGCYYMTNYFDTVAQHWKDFNVVPMAANVQFIFFKAKRSGRYYVRVDLNEKPVTLIPNDERLYLPWTEARNYLMHCLPLIMQF